MSDTPFKRAVIIGATGATGQHLLTGLLSHPAYDSVTVLTRRPTGVSHPKLDEHIVDFEQPDEWSDLVRGDELFSALGTTLKSAGSQQAQRKVDVTYQLDVATAARSNQVGKLLLISSPGADPDSRNFYLKMKGELDQAVEALDFEHTVLIKPSIIVSERPDSRPGERLAACALAWLSPWFGPVKKYRPITAVDLATAIIEIAQSHLKPGKSYLELNKIFDYLPEKNASESNT